jgi:glycosyltransferase involved in cell wall biosynthesis
MKVSVLVTAYQHEAFIAECLEGILAQRGVAFELLVGDDASTDGTREVIDRYARAHPDVIRTFFPDRNMGQGGKVLFDVLVNRARGDYLAMLDGDDFWTSADKLCRQAAYLDDHPECAMCFHDVLRVVDGSDDPAERYNGSDRPLMLGVSDLLHRCIVASCSPMFRRETIAPLPPWYFELPWGDWSLYFMAAEHGELHYLPDVMGVYRIHRGGMYQGISRLQDLENRTAFYRGVHVPAAYERSRRRTIGDTYLKRAREHDRLGQRGAAARCLAEAIRARPSIMLTVPPALRERWRGRAGTTRLDPG